MCLPRCGGRPAFLRFFGFGFDSSVLVFAIVFCVVCVFGVCSEAENAFNILCMCSRLPDGPETGLMIFCECFVVDLKKKCFQDVF